MIIQSLHIGASFSSIKILNYAAASTLYGILLSQRPGDHDVPPVPESKVSPKAVEHWRRLQSPAHLGRAVYFRFGLSAAPSRISLTPKLLSFR